jgi:sodium-dependent dicarboxylate transporter 2/3/5
MDERGGGVGTGRAARIGLVAGPLAFAALLVVPLPTLALEGAPVEATTSCRVVLGLTAWMAAWWMTEALPLAATSLLPLVVLPVAGVRPAKAVARGYFDDTLTLFLGGFGLAIALEKSGLHRRIALVVLGMFGTRPRAIVLGLFVASATISMWVSNTATALMLMPVATTAVLAVLGKPQAEWSGPERNLAACSVLAVAYGGSLGGIGTLVGTPPNMLFKRHHDDLVLRGHGPEVTFGDWFAFGAPIVALVVPIAWWVLTRFALPVPARLGAGSAPAALPTSGRMRRDEGWVLGIFLATALAWVTHARMELWGWTVPVTGWDRAFTFGSPESFVTDGTIAVATMLLLFVLPSGAARGDRLLTWQHVHDRIPWAALLLFGGGFSLAEAFPASGLDAYLKAAFRGLEGMPTWALLLVVAAGVTAVSEVASNTATAAMLLPILSSVAIAAGLAPLPVLLAGTVAASCGFALPVATMANTIAYGTGLVTPGQMGRAGWLLDVVGVLLVVAVVLLWVPVVFGR